MFVFVFFHFVYLFCLVLFIVLFVCFIVCFFFIVFCFCFFFYIVCFPLVVRSSVLPYKLLVSLFKLLFCFDHISPIQVCTIPFPFINYLDQRYVTISTCWRSPTVRHPQGQPEARVISRQVETSLDDGGDTRAVNSDQFGYITSHPSSRPIGLW